MSAFLQSIYEFDLSVFSAVFAIGNDVLDTIMKVITTLGDGWIMPVFAVILLIFKKTRKAGMTMLGALLVMLILNNEILKPMIARIRPCFMFSLENLMSMKEVFIENFNGQKDLILLAVNYIEDYVKRYDFIVKTKHQSKNFWDEAYYKGYLNGLILIKVFKWNLF